jgi:hypothetical protein
MSCRSYRAEDYAGIKEGAWSVCYTACYARIGKGGEKKNSCRYKL